MFILMQRDFHYVFSEEIDGGLIHHLVNARSERQSKAKDFVDEFTAFPFEAGHVCALFCERQLVKALIVLSSNSFLISIPFLSSYLTIKSPFLRSWMALDMESSLHGNVYFSRL